MMLRRISSAGVATTLRPLRRAPLSSLSFPTDAAVDDDTVSVTFIDYMGGRHERRARVGQTLVDVCRMYNMDLLEDDSVHQVSQRSFSLYRERD